MGFVLACDLGGTSFRAALVDERGCIVAGTSLVGPAETDTRHGSEINADDWWRNFLDASTQLILESRAAFAAIEAIAICGITRTQVVVGRDGKPLRAAITWRDSRAGDAAARLKSRFAGVHPEAEHLNAYHPLARLAWLSEEEPETFRTIAAVLEPKDYLNFRLTGTQATDPVSYARLLASASPLLAGSDSLLEAIGTSVRIVPPRREPWEVMGHVSDGLPPPLDKLTGVPVICGSNDTWVGVVGLGAMRPGFAYNISGTTEVLGVLSREPRNAEGLLSVDWRGLYQLGGPSQNGADTVAWLVSLLQGEDQRRPLGATISGLLEGPRDPQPLLFLPYLQGERVPYWDPDLRGAFIGLNRRHGATDLAWAVLEGVAFLNRMVLERAELGLGRLVQEIRFGGGAAVNTVWRQVKADICRRAVAVGASQEPGVLGAAILAWTALGRFPSLTAAQDALVAIAARHEPDPDRGAHYDSLYRLFRQCETALAPVAHDLVKLARGP